jgi:hypothetical protein
MTTAYMRRHDDRDKNKLVADIRWYGARLGPAWHEAEVAEAFEDGLT